MSDTPPTDPGHERALGEARELLAGGLLGELITNTNRVAGAIEHFAAELTLDRNARAAELRSLRRRNGVQAGALAASILLLAAVLLIGGGRLTKIAETNQANGRYLTECTTPSPRPEVALDEADVVHECYEDGLVRQAAAVSSIGADVLDAAICARTHPDEPAIAECFRARVAQRQEPSHP